MQGVCLSISRHVWERMVQHYMGAGLFSDMRNPFPAVLLFFFFLFFFLLVLAYIVAARARRCSHK